MIQIRKELLPYHAHLETRDVNTLELVVLHCTELPDLSTARKFGERILYAESSTGNSGHYYIDRDGSIAQYVEDDRVARHVIGHNTASLGIELVNTGRYPHWFHAEHQSMTEPYAMAQIAALKELLVDIHARHPSVTRLARHSDLDTAMMAAEDHPSAQVRRRLDPGPMFPWEDVKAFWNTVIGGIMDADAKQIIEGMIGAWKKAAEARDLERLLALIADECVFIAPAAPPVRGKEAAKAMFLTVWSRVKEHHQTFTVEEAFIAGDWLIAWGQETATLVPNEGEAAKFEGHGFMILKRAGDTWQFARGINSMIKKH